jgi:SAM-dependent methyltransferase
LRHVAGTPKLQRLVDDSRTGDRVEPRDHWEAVYRTKDLTRVSWYQARPDLSLELISRAGVGLDARILDVGAGTSSLVDHLLEAGYRSVGVLDIAVTALDLTRQRLGDRATDVEWFHSSVTDFVSPHPWDVWHDRAVLHFLTEEEDRTGYRLRMESSLAEGGVVVLSTFGPEGPERCSGLDVRRYGVEEMADWIGPGFSLEHDHIVEHESPGGAVQQFVFCLFRRVDGACCSEAI